ncbi:hypothetical protein FGO68_gene13337 [Halteria grandinella]|uniref:Uncharacterized protein n=1 Tax=Halteria grandinella TaxID=5974 RepID=A0A8J8T9Y2_HALGN|nr:hypothetical protein FGO68_gene13337 [Halteria grandinella]
MVLIVRSVVTVQSEIQQKSCVWLDQESPYIRQKNYIRFFKHVKNYAQSKSMNSKRKPIIVCCYHDVCC